MSAPLQFAFGLHLHQPVGNFDSVFEEHLEAVYRPLLREVVAGGCAPVTLHLSGPLIDWLDGHAPGYLDELGRLVFDGRVELLLAGYDEPILAVLPREDRLEQIARMREALRSRFGIEATGLWLTERVWEPDLAGDLAAAGVRYALVDDRHFLAAGFEREELHQPYVTESGGGRIALFPIDERLRYLVPFGAPAKFAEYVQSLRAQGHALAVLADDGEKFGGWPGTREWVYEKGWLRGFLEILDRLRESGALRLVTFSTALTEVPPGGLAYLPSASYREMEGWALPPTAALRLQALERDLGEAQLEGPVGALVRGSHWRHFLVKYPEANRMHKKMLALSALCRNRGDPGEARRAIGRAQCNDAYWHGVFGGLYLPHLREAVWRELARAEGLLRSGEGLRYERLDLDADGRDEIWIHSDRVSVVLAPGRGGAVEDWTLFATGINHAATLTRRREAYHETPPPSDQAGGTEGGGGGAPSIHDLKARLGFEEKPPVDRDPRAILQERVWSGSVTVADLVSGAASPLRSWARESGEPYVLATPDRVTVTIKLPGLEKRIAAHPDGTLEVELRWEVDPAWGASALFSSELSLFRPVVVEAAGSVRGSYTIETVSKSERGFDRTVQGEAIVLSWSAAARRAAFVLRPPPAP